MCNENTWNLTKVYLAYVNKCDNEDCHKFIGAAYTSYRKASQAFLDNGYKPYLHIEGRGCVVFYYRDDNLDDGCIINSEGWIEEVHLL